MLIQTHRKNRLKTCTQRLRRNGGSRTRTADGRKIIWAKNIPPTQMMTAMMCRLMLILNVVLQKTVCEASYRLRLSNAKSRLCKYWRINVKCAPFLSDLIIEDLPCQILKYNHQKTIQPLIFYGLEMRLSN